MPIVQHSYKYRIYPDDSQKIFLEKNFGCVRFVWNKLVEAFNANDKSIKVTEQTLKNDPEYPFLQDVISYALQQKRMDFDETKKQFFNKGRKKKLGRMQFKKKGRNKDSFRIPGQALGFNKCIGFDKGTIKLPKMTPIKIIIDRKFSGTLKSVTVSKNSCDQYFVSVLVEEDVELKQNTGKSVGIDLGIKDLLVFSDGLVFNNPKWFRNSQVKLEKQQKHLSRKQKGSNRYLKQKRKVARIHQDIKNQRNYTLNCLTTMIVDNYDTIILENLNVSGMLKNHKLAKSIADASFATIVSMLKYKCNWYGKTFHQVDRFFASSKLCHCCGHKMASEEMSLDVREWKCPSCSTLHDRDLNAARNILIEGLSDLYGLTSDEKVDVGFLSESLNRRGEDVRLGGYLATRNQLAASMKRLDVYNSDNNH